MKFRKLFEGKWVPYTIASCSAVLVYLFFSHLDVFFGAISTFLKIIEPIITGIVLAYIVSPLISWIELHILRRVKHEKLRYNLSMVLALALIAVLIGLLMSLLIPQLVSSVIQFLSNLNYYSSKLSALFIDIREQAGAMNLDISSITSFGDDLFNDLASLLTRNANRIINGSFSLGGKSVNIVIGIILALYFLADKKTMLGGVERLMRILLSDRRYRSCEQFLVSCNEILTKYVVGDILDAVIVGVINAIFMLVTGMPYTVLISVVVGVTNLAPTFGPFVGAFIGAFVLIFAEPVDAGIFLIFTLILQMIDGYVVKPRLFGGSLGVSGVWIVIGIIIGGKLFGVMGILLAIPEVAILNSVYHDFIGRRERQKGIK